MEQLNRQTVTLQDVKNNLMKYVYNVSGNTVKIQTCASCGCRAQESLLKCKRIIITDEKMNIFKAKPATIEAVTTAPTAELFLDGVSQGVLPTQRNARNEIQPTEWTAKSSVANDNSDGQSACWIGRAREGVGKCGLPRKGTWEGGQRHLGSGECTGFESFPINATGVQCHDLKRDSAKSPADCATACCANENCDTWQWELSDPGPAPVFDRNWCACVFIYKLSMFWPHA